MDEGAVGDDGFPGLGWPIKASFARYVANLPDGQGALDGAIVASPRVGLVFGLADASAFDVGRRKGLLKFGGRIGFRGHFGMLSVDIAEPWLRIDGDHAVISIAAPTPSDPAGRKDIATAALRWTDDETVECRSVTVTITATGSALFGGTYGEGTDLDPFVLRLE